MPEALAAPNARGLPDAVVRFARALRDAGVAVSAAEVLDAIEALELLPLERREALRATLAAALLKGRGQRQRFDRLFDIHFPVHRHLARPPGASERRPGDVVDEVAEALRSGDERRLREVSSELVRRRGEVRGDVELSEDAFAFSAMRGLNLDAIRDRLRDETVEGRGKSAIERRLIEEDLTEQIERFRRMVQDEVFSALLDELGPERMSRRDRRRPPDEIDFLWATDRDLDALRAAIAPLARRLARRLSHQRRHARRGRLDVRRTIRRSLSTGGHFADPAFRRPAAGKPDVMLLCDISGSMRAFARFVLELTYTLADQFQHVRTFVFVDALDEVTELLDDPVGGLAAALGRIDEHADVVHLDGQSWYGNCLEQFWERAGHDVTARTTVIVLGDARNNFRTTGADRLTTVRERARSVHWLNPEPRSHWDTGDSVQAEFAAACDAVYEVRNLRQLEAYVAGAI